MVVMMMGARRLRQILDVGDLAALRGAAEIARKLGELVRRRRIALRRGGLGRGFQICRDLLGDLLVLSRVRLLKLLEHAHQLGERGKPALVRLHDRGRIDAAQAVAGLAGCRAGVPERAAENRL